MISGAHVVVYECAFHPSEQNGPRELYLMCNNLKEEIASLKTKGVECSEIQEQRWGLFHRFNCLAEASWGFTRPGMPVPCLRELRKLWSNAYLLLRVAFTNRAGG